MTIPPAIIDSIQRAGAAVFAAQVEVAAASQAQGQQVAQAMTTNPFGLANDGMIESWKTLSRLAQQLQMVESQLRSVHEAASSLVNTNDILVTDVPQLAAPRRIKSVKKVVPVAAPAPTAPSAPMSVVKAAVRGNDAKVLDYLQKVLTSDSDTLVRQNQISQGAAIPLGSVARSLSQLIARGCLREGAKSCYRLI